MNHLAQAATRRRRPTALVAPRRAVASSSRTLVADLCSGASPARQPPTSVGPPSSGRLRCRSRSRRRSAALADARALAPSCPGSRHEPEWSRGGGLRASPPGRRLGTLWSAAPVGRHLHCAAPSTWRSSPRRRPACGCSRTPDDTASTPDGRFQHLRGQAGRRERGRADHFRHIDRLRPRSSGGDRPELLEESDR